jgi:cytochrome c553
MARSRRTAWRRIGWPLFAVALALGSAVTLQGADPQVGRMKAAACEGCHGPQGQGTPANPPIAGMPVERFVRALKSYRARAREEAAMTILAHDLSDRDIGDLAAYYQSLR